MSHDLHKQLQLIRDTLRVDWDHIGVGEIPEAHDEYDSYAAPIHALIVGGNPREEIIAYLTWLETEQIGMPGDPAGVEAFADRLLQFRSDFAVANG